MGSIGVTEGGSLRGEDIGDLVVGGAYSLRIAPAKSVGDDAREEKEYWDVHASTVSESSNDRNRSV